MDTLDSDLIKNIILNKGFNSYHCFYIDEEIGEFRETFRKVNREIRKYNNLRDRIFNDDDVVIKSTTYDNIAYISLHTDNRKNLIETLKNIFIFIDILNVLYDMNPKIVIENFYLNNQDEIEYEDLVSYFENENIKIEKKY